MKKGTTFEARIEKFADRGKSLARIDGYVVFFPGGVPGDRVRATLVRSTSRHGEARVDELIEPSPLRTEPRCRYFGTCGGCKWQHVRYGAQLEAKAQSVAEAFEHHGGFEHPVVHPALGSESEWFYRNKMEFSFSAERWLTREEIASGERFDLGFALGLHAPGHFNKVIDLTECHLQSPLSVELVNGFRRLALDRGWDAWHLRRHQGYLRHLVIRQALHTGDLMVNLVTSRLDEERNEEVAAFLRTGFPQVTTFVNGVHSGVAQTAFGESLHTVFGPGLVRDRIGPYTFEIGPNAFFQTNTAQAERLYDVAKSYARLEPDDLVYDLYCGAGSISLFVAGDVRQVVGVELIEDAVVNARANAKANGVGNVVFETGDMLKLFTPDFVRKHGRPDVLIVDPPRAGMHPKVVRQIAELRPGRFVYVSCNPLTQARDLAALADAYTLEELQPVDLFPHTYHVENVARLTARS
jgi:23S rRNA (uracil1939-C5)-methyltransferase